MKKKLFFIAIATLLTIALMVPTAAVMAAKGDNPANDNPNNLYLYQKDANWDIVWGGAWGKYNYSLSGTTITGPFNGHGLVPGTGYTLVEYNGWPTVTVIGKGVADVDGDVHIAGTTDLGPGGETTGEYKIWLVLSADITAGALNKWNPGSYLFEHNLILSD